MPELDIPGESRFAFAVAFGLVLIVLARWASRARGTKRDTWIALRVGDVLLTEVIGAFFVGYGLGGFVAQPETAVRGGPPGRIGPGGRFGGLGPSLPVAIGTVAAAIVVLTRLDLSNIVLRGSTPRNGMSVYIGYDARVIAPIQAGGYGQIAMQDALGYPLSAGATAETDIPEGTAVRVIGAKDLKLLVAPIPPATESTQSAGDTIEQPST
jgi:membrane protein implicated in regulation of membrane protease activity